MRYHTIRKMDISNGPGVRVSVFEQGCEFHCKNCFNPETWDFEDGKEFTSDTLAFILQLCSPDHIRGLSILGGEPMHPANVKGTEMLARAFKERYPEKDLWIWSGFLFDRNLVNNPETRAVLQHTDVLIDGPYQDELHDFRLKWRGSSNQRVINVQKSLAEGTVVTLE